MPHPLEPQVTQLIVSTVVAVFVLRYYSKNRSLVGEKYHTFWPRFLGPHIDRMALWIPLALAPYLIAQHYDFDLSAIQTTYIVITILHFVYSICFHALFGGTLGKLGTKLRVVRAKDETPISWVHAILRDLIPLSLSITISVMAIQLFDHAAPTETNQDILAMAEDRQSLPSVHPASETLAYLGLIILGWYLLELVTMLTNSKRRALHDFIAGTVVVRINLKEPEVRPVVLSDGARLETNQTSPMKIQKPSS